GIALQICDLAGAMGEDHGQPMTLLKVDGGAANNSLLMQLQADLCALTVVRPTMVETTGLGAAMLAGLGCGFWDDTATLSAAWREDRRFHPQMDGERRRELLNAWHRAV